MKVLKPRVEIYSGTISIDANEDGINAASSDNDCDETVRCSGNCACYIKFSGGDLTLKSNEDGIDSNGDITISGGNIVVFAATDSENQPIDQDGLLSITGGNIIAAGSAKMEGGISGTTNQTAKIYSGTINEGVKLVITNGDGEELKSLTTIKAASYIYFNFPTTFSVKLNGNEIALSEPSENKGNNDGKDGPFDPNRLDNHGPPGDNDNNDNNNDCYINLSKYLLIFGLILM